MFLFVHKIMRGATGYTKLYNRQIRYYLLVSKLTTLEELALTEVSNLSISTSVFSPEDTVSKILGVLKDTKRTEAVASDNEKYGVIAVRDLLGVDQPEQTKVRKIWKQIGTITPSTSILKATELILNNVVPAVPVLDGKKVYLVSQQDIVGALKTVEGLKTTEVKNIMQSPVHTMSVDSPISHIRHTMRDKNYSFIPITENEKLVGMVTAEDIVHTFVTSASKTTRGDRSGKKVTRFPGQASGFMNMEPLTVNIDSTVHEVIRGMTATGRKACLVVDDENHVQGIITEMELLELIYDLVESRDELPVYILGVEEEDFLEKSIVEDKIRRVVERSIKIHPITEISVNVKTQRSKGERKRYKITIRAMGPTNSFNVTNEEWGLMEAFDGVVDQLSKTMRRGKKNTHKGKRRGRRRPNPHLKFRN